MKRILFIILIFILLTSLNLFSKESNELKNVKVIAVTCSAYFYNQTIIDLNNNEIVIMVYKLLNTGAKLVDTVRTGLIVNPGDYKKVSMLSSPFSDDD